MARRDKVHRPPRGAQIGGLKWVGRNSDGISMWRGLWRTIPKWFCNSFRILGVSLIGLAFIFAAVGLWQAVPGPLVAGIGHSMFGFYFLERWRNKMNNLMTAEQAAEQLRLGQDEITRMIENEGVRPTYILNDEPIYELSAFGDAGRLLRSSESPMIEKATLLRPAGNGARNEQADQLLRPVNAESESLGLVQGICQANSEPIAASQDQGVNIANAT